MDLPVGPTNLSSTAAPNQQQHQDRTATATTTTNYNALIANSLPLQQLLANRHPTSSCGLAFAAAALAFQHSQLQQAAHHQHHHQQQQQQAAPHIPAVNLSTGPAQQQPQAPPPPPPTAPAPPTSSFTAATQQSTAQTRMAQAAAAPLQGYPGSASYNMYPTTQPTPQQQLGSVNQQTSNPMPQQPQTQQQQQQPQTTTTSNTTTTVPQLPPFYPFAQWEQALALLARPDVASNIFHVFNLYLQGGLRADPHHSHHHHHTGVPYHYHHHLHGSHHHHHHHYGPHGQNNGQDDAMLTINESKPRGLNRAEIDSLPPYIQMNEKDSRTCVICLSRFEPKSKIRPLPCNHAFHAKCVDKWLRANRTCPICRRDALKPHMAKIKRIS